MVPNLPRGRRSTSLLFLALILLLAAALRFYRLDAQSFWNDEGNSARIAERPLDKIVEGAAGDIHPPGYYLLLAAWRATTGQSEFTLRSFSAFTGVLTVALACTTGTRLFNRRVGNVAALLAACVPFQVYYGQEARMYALLGLLNVGSVWLTIELFPLLRTSITGTRRGWRTSIIVAGYILVNVMGLYTHYSFPLILLAEALIFLLWLVRQRKKWRVLLTWAGLQLITVILFLPWLPIALRQMTTWPSNGSGNVSLQTLATTLAYGITTPPDAASFGLIPMFLVAAVGLLPPIDQDDLTHDLNHAERIGLIAAWLLAIPTSLSAVGALSEPFLKFLLPANLALAILVACGTVTGFDLATSTPGPLSVPLFRPVVAILLAAALVPIPISLRHLYFDPTYVRDDYRAIAARIQNESGTEAAVVLNAPNQWEVFTYYYPDGPGIAPLPDQHTGERLTELLGSYDRIYALYWGETQQDPNRVVESTLESGAFPVSTEWYGSVRLAIYAVPATPATQIESPSGALFGDSITLAGFTLSDTTLRPGEAIGVTLFWQASAPITARYKVFVHLYTPDGRLVGQHDGEPAGNLKPTDSWMPGELVIDNHGLLLPPHIPTGVYHLSVGLYGLDGTRLPVSANDTQIGDKLLLAEIIVGA